MIPASTAMYRRKTIARPPRLLLISASLLCCGVSAQQSNTLEEMIVTAQHREESAQSTPISLFTFSATQLENQRITSIENLSGLVPNLSIDSFPSNNQALRLFIRGVGLTDAQLTQDPAVGVYLNGAYIARSTGLAFDIADLERIEVLRGPQGTLYGRNTTAGAIKLVTRKPTVEGLAFDQTLSAGNQDLLSSRTSVNLPLTRRHAVKLAYFHEDVSGFTDNDGPGGNWGDRESQGLRLDWRAAISDQLTLDYSYDWARISSYNQAAQAVTPRQSGDGLLSIVGDIAQQYITYDNNRINTLSTTTALLPTDTRVSGHTLNLDWALHDYLTIRSISAWRELSDKSYVDFASGASAGFRIDFNSAVIGANAGEERRDLPATRPDLNHEQFSQELQFIGNVGESMQYLAGLYYFAERAEEAISPTRHIFSAAPFAGGTIYNLGTEYNEIDNDALAVFTQFTWTPGILDRRMHLTLGWRHSEDSRKAVREVTDEVVVDQDAFILGLTSTQFSADTNDDYSDDSFTFIAAYDWTQDINLYAKYAEAYKSGGFNIRDPDEDGFSNGFDEEKLRAIEAGFKGELLDRSLRVNAAVFHQQFEDFQYNFQIPGTIQGSRVFNVDEGEMSGLELEVQAMPLPGLFLNLSYAYLHTELDDVISPLDGQLRSAEFANGPENTYSIVVDYALPPLSFGTLGFNASYNFVDDRTQQNAATFRDDYDLLNVRLSLTDIAGLGGEWRLAAWGKNLQDSDYEVFTLGNLPQAERAVIWADGRTYGIDVTYQFQ